MNKILITIFLIFHYLTPKAAEILVKNDNLNKIEVNKYIEILKDPSGTLRFEDIIHSKDFKLNEQYVPNLGISNAAYWVKFQIKNTSETPLLLLELGHPFIDDVEFYSPASTGNGYEVYRTGDKYPFSKRIYENQNYIFNLPLPKGETRTFYMRVKSGEQINLPFRMGTTKFIFENNHTKDIIFGIFCGVIFVMFFYNIFIYFTVNDKVYLYYVVYILAIGMTQAALLGYPFEYLWPDSPRFANLSVYLFSCTVGISAMEFLKVFLQSRSYIPRLHKISYIFTGLYVMTAIIALLGFYNLSYFFVLFNAGTIAAFMLIMAVVVLKKGYKPAKFFLIAWTTLLIGICIYVLKDFNLLPSNLFTSYTMPAGSALETILLSFALADRINILKKEKEESQKRTLEILQENDRILKEANTELDRRVKERTAELEKSNSELANAIDELKQTQAQLVSSEKMASLGQLTAGVAHEINNPINFVTSAVKPLRRDIDDILGIMEKYDDLDETNFRIKEKEIRKLKEDLDLEYLKEEIASLLKGIDEGATRTAEIVKGLRTFSRIDEMDLKRVDLNEGLDSTLILLSSQMRDKVQVEKNYMTDAKVECYAGKVNQVFMNILNNSIHAITAHHADGQGKITVTTREEGENVVVSIKDNGTGIPENIRTKIFDPFFTTKDVGEGTGLGLSIVYNIIESHKGKIEVFSEIGKGAEFVITLPKLQGAK